MCGRVRVYVRMTLRCPLGCKHVRSRVRICAQQCVVRCLVCMWARVCRCSVRVPGVVVARYCGRTLHVQQYVAIGKQQSKHHTLNDNKIDPTASKHNTKHNAQINKWQQRNTCNRTGNTNNLETAHTHTPHTTQHKQCVPSQCNSTAQEQTTTHTH